MKYQFTHTNKEPCDSVHDENQIAESMHRTRCLLDSKKQESDGWEV